MKKKTSGRTKEEALKTERSQGFCLVGLIGLEPTTSTMSTHKLCDYALYPVEKKQAKSMYFYSSVLSGNIL